jgi:resuscitation-promoting factor RpfA
VARRAFMRVAIAALVVGCALKALQWATTTTLMAVRDGSGSFDDVVCLTAALACWALLGWVGLVLALTVLATVPGGVGRLATEAGTRLAPVAMRRAARLTLGLTILAGPVALATPVGAATLVSPRVVAATDHPSVVSDALLLPDVSRPGWSESPGPPARSSDSGTGSGRRDVVTVVPGDCLWTIAATHLGRSDSSAEIAAAWPRWYAANRRVIGPDPDLLLPGTVLRAPAPR